MADRSAPGPVTNPLVRLLLTLGGLVMIGLGVAGLIVPGLPGTPLLLVAAWLFSMSNLRLYDWMVTNRWFGGMLADYLAGLGIPRRVKVVAVGLVGVVVTTSVLVALDSMWLRALVAGLGVLGVLFILTRPTRESVLADTRPEPSHRSRQSVAGDDL